MIRFTITSKNGEELCRVETASVDDFYNLRDKIHSALETGEFGSRFPTLMNRFEPAEWSVQEIPKLQRELETIAEAFQKLPPQPDVASLQRWDEIHQGRYATLYDVYADAEGKPLLGRLIALCERARKAARPIRME
ncbi:MAG: hypothetical protein HYY21_07505 [Candidatus Tectomicrobia bacterium]|nr:hypothetical protein [Candidatus Tectomicrobia bacterium]